MQWPGPVSGATPRVRSSTHPAAVQVHDTATACVRWQHARHVPVVSSGPLRRSRAERGGASESARRWCLDASTQSPDRAPPRATHLDSCTPLCGTVSVAPNRNSHAWRHRSATGQRQCLGAGFARAKSVGVSAIANATQCSNGEEDAHVTPLSARSGRQRAGHCRMRVTPRRLAIAQLGRGTGLVSVAGRMAVANPSGPTAAQAAGRRNVEGHVGGGSRNCDIHQHDVAAAVRPFRPGRTRGCRTRCAAGSRCRAMPERVLQRGTDPARPRPMASVAANASHRGRPAPRRGPGRRRSGVASGGAAAMPSRSRCPVDRPQQVRLVQHVAFEHSVSDARDGRSDNDRARPARATGTGGGWRRDHAGILTGVPRCDAMMVTRGAALSRPRLATVQLSGFEQSRSRLGP